ncbi:hypothetical protein NHF50_01620 [Flavobacterium sp. NRK F10]|uniref:DUF6588 family protein n=1 Tax=Flavobacterium sp. NRK F10 TaxID=2954931 RepID=UPI0020917109|nr:DUF6588 family protein [Flavobacterium sp. NRK F10]MCO6173736.1 hypothetical protein [Flavobacterium sp. NRK F10]
MRKTNCSIAVLFMLCFSMAKAQTTLEQEIGYLLSDALFYSEKYIIPATDGAVYQASSAWMSTAKKREKWTVEAGIYGNVFFVPNRDRSFTVSNSDFQFFQIEGAESATVPTALGDNHQVYLVGDLDGEQIRFKTPQGINQETVVYPYLQVGVVLPYGFEVMGKYSTRTKLKKGDYQVFGFGLKHNFSQYFPSLETKKINLAAMMMYSNEDISFDFLDVNTSYGNMGINRFTGIVNTYHLQLAASKEIKDFELMLSFIANVSDFSYKVNGTTEEPTIFANAINDLLPELEETKFNYVGEFSVNYFFNKFYAKGTFSFGKFANANLGLNYIIN